MNTPLQQAAQQALEAISIASLRCVSEAETCKVLAANVALRKALDAEQAQAVEPVASLSFYGGKKRAHPHPPTDKDIENGWKPLYTHPAPPVTGKRADLIEQLRALSVTMGDVQKSADMLEADAQEIARLHADSAFDHSEYKRLRDELLTQLARRTVERDMAIGMAAGIEAQQALSLDLLERLSKTLTRLGYSTPEGGMEHFGARIESQLYNLCRGVDALLAQQVAVPQAMEDLTGVTVCCGDFAKCHRPCTPRGQWMATKAYQVAVPDGWALVPIEPTPEMIAAMSTSQAQDCEGAFPALMDLIDFSGENKTRTVIKAAYTAMLAAAQKAKPSHTDWSAA